MFTVDVKQQCNNNNKVATCTSFTPNGFAVVKPKFGNATANTLGEKPELFSNNFNYLHFNPKTSFYKFLLSYLLYAKTFLLAFMIELCKSLFCLRETFIN